MNYNKTMWLSALLVTSSLAQSNEMPARKENNESQVRTSDQAVSAQKVNKEQEPVNFYAYHVDQLKNFAGKLPERHLIITYLLEVKNKPETLDQWAPTTMIIGESGTGKTLLVKEVVRESGAELLTISIPAIVKNHHNVGANQAIYEIFDKGHELAIKENKLVIILIEDLDFVTTTGPDTDMERTVAIALFKMLQGLETNKIKVVATAKTIDGMEYDLYRRFSLPFKMPLPDEQDRKAIFEFHASNFTLEQDVNFSTLAAKSKGFAGGEIVQTLNDADDLRKERKADTITQADLSHALKQVTKSLPAHRQEGTNQSIQNFLAKNGGKLAIGFVLAVIAATIVSDPGEFAKMFKDKPIWRALAYFFRTGGSGGTD